MNPAADNYSACWNCEHRSDYRCTKSAPHPMQRPDDLFGLDHITIRSHGLGCPIGKFAAFKIEVPVDPFRGIPLVGDQLKAAIARFGGDRLAAWIKTKTGVDCGCEGRVAFVNRVERLVREYLARKHQWDW